VQALAAGGVAQGIPAIGCQSDGQLWYFARTWDWEKQVNKRLLVTVVILVLLYPVMAWVTGRVIESRTSAALAELTDKAPYLTVTEVKYHRGWYTSEQDLTLSLFATQMAGLAPLMGGNGQVLAKGVPISLHSVIHHGPICGWSCFALARVNSHLVLSNEAKAAITLIYGSAEPLTITARMGFLGGGTTIFSSPALNGTALPGGAKLSSDGFKIRVDYTRHHDAYKIDGSLPHVLVDGPDGKRFEIRSVAFKGNSTRALGELYASDFDFGIDSISYSGAQGSSPFLLSDFKYVGKSTIDGGFMSIALQLDSGAIGAAEVKLKDAKFDLSFKHLDMAALAALTDKLRALYKQQASDPAKYSQNMAAVLKEQGLPLLLKQPVLSLDRIGLDTMSGQVLLTGTLSIPGVTAADLASDAGIAALKQKLVGDFEVSLDDSALNELPGTSSILPQLENMAQHGYFTHENGRWHATIHSANGQNSFNGKLFEPAALAPPTPPPAQLPPPALKRR
jgi:uncharacterized protein YdgA (DUF945 family)